MFIAPLEPKVLRLRRPMCGKSPTFRVQLHFDLGCALFFVVDSIIGGTAPLIHQAQAGRPQAFRTSGGKAANSRGCA